MPCWPSHWPLGMRYNRKPKGRNDGVCKVLVQDRLHKLAMQKGRLFSKDSFANFSLVKIGTDWHRTDGATIFFPFGFAICSELSRACLELSLVFVVHAFGSPSGFVFFFFPSWFPQVHLYIFVLYTSTFKGVPNGSRHPLGFSWHPFLGAPCSSRFGKSPVDPGEANRQAADGGNGRIEWKT